MKRLALSALLILLTLPSLALAQTYEDADKAYETGDYAKAKEILLPLAENGHAKAMNLLGLMHDFGKGYPKDATTACDWYEKAAQAENLAAKYNLSLCFQNADGRKHDLAEALRLQEEAAELGDVGAQVALIQHYGDTDKEKARYWGERAVKAGSALARAALWGHDISYDGPKATTWDIACSLVMIGIFQKPADYCD